MRIQNNIMALNTHRFYTNNNNAVSKSAEKLSSGYKINRAGDDAAGLAISEKMRREIRGLSMASKNAQDGVSMVQTAEGALQEVHSMLQRMSEIAVQAASDSNDDAVDRPSLDAEFQQLIKEIDQIAETTTFNDMNLLDGSFTNKFVQVGSNKGVELEISIDSMSAGALGLAVKTGDDMATLAGVTGSTVSNGTAAGTKNVSTVNGAPSAAKTTADIVIEENALTLVGDALNVTTTGTGAAVTIADDGAGTLSLKVGTEVVGKADYSGEASDTLNNGDPHTFTFKDAGITVGTLVVKGTGTTSTVGGAADAVADAAAYGTASGLTVDTAAPAPATAASFTLDAAGATLDKESSVTMTVGTGADAVKLTVAVADGDEDGTISDQEIADAFNGKEIKFGGKTFQAVTAGTDVTFTATETGALDAGAAGATVAVAADNGAAVGVKNRENALNAIDSVKAAIRTVSDQRAALGAVQNRLEHKISNLDNTVENVSAAESRIRDVDIAKEMTNFTKNNILSQAATAMLAQANAAPQGVLSLLQ